MEKSIGPINSIVLARAGESDKIYKKDQNSIELNGLCELMIKENQFMNFNDRVDYLQELSEKLFGVEYYLNDFVSTGIMYYDLLDMYNVEIFGKTYNCLMLNDEQNITQGLEENIHTDRPEKSETDYKKADTTDRKINQTNFIVDKQNQKIEALVTSNTELNQKTAQLRIDVDTIAGEISDIADVTITAEGNGTIQLENINESEPILIKIHPQTNDLTPLYLDDNIYLSNDLYMHDREVYIRNTTDDTEIVYNIPNDLYYLDGIYDEFVLDYENQQCYITHRIEKVNGVKRLKEIETTEELPYPTIRLTEGDYTITIPYNLTTYIYARLMSKNLYTSQFATKVEVNSKITQTAQDITLSTDKKLEDYSTTTEMNSAITVKANEITSSVSETYETKENASSQYETKENASKQYSNIKQTTDNITTEVGKKVGNDEVISKINQSAEAVGIKADKIELTANDVLNLLAGNEINLSSKTISIKSNVLNITSDGAIRMYLPNDGYVAIQLTDTQSKISSLLTATEFNFGGNFQCSGGVRTTDGTGFLNVKGDISCETLIQTSLAEKKKNFEKMQNNALEVIKNIDIYKYNLKNEKDTDKKHLGFVIGNNYNYSKEVTSIDNTGVDNYSFTSLCCKAIQEQQKQIEELKKEIDILKGEKNG